jgi:CHAD domain-containing protein
VSTEREVKLGVWPGFTMPDLGDATAGATTSELPAQRLEATYHDTATLSLARMGITLRHRTGDTGGDVWTLKLPTDRRTRLLVRDEIDVPGDATAIPSELVDRVVAWTRAARLEPVARLQTTRQRLAVCSGEGVALAEVVDDEVSVLERRRVALRFREVEVELAPDADEAILDSIVSRLRNAGAGPPDPTPKVIRALGPRATTPPDFAVPALPRVPSGADLVRVGIASGVDRLLRHDAGVRLDADVESVHQARVATRRLRSDLRTLSPLVDQTWRAGLEDQLEWLASLLGAVRDADVLQARLRAEIAALGSDDPDAGDQVLAVLAAEREHALAELQRAMRSKRYVHLLDSLVHATSAPHLTTVATRDASEVAPELASVPWRSLAKAAARAGRDPSDETLHAIRKRAKRARYAAELSAHVVGKPATRFAKAVARVQEVLGEHQDATVEREWLCDNVDRLAPRAALLAGRLVARADDASIASRAQWRDAWQRVDEGKVSAWLSR